MSLNKHILVYIFPFCSILIFEDSFLNHLSVKLISSIKMMMMIIIVIIKSTFFFQKLSFSSLILSN